MYKMDKMLTEGTEVERTDLPISEESLISLEKLDRSSPDLWPEQGIDKLVAQNLSQNEYPAWLTNLTNDDNNQLNKLGILTIDKLILEVKKLHDTAYQLGLEEAKEMTRGKYLNILKQK